MEKVGVSAVLKRFRKTQERLETHEKHEEKKKPVIEEVVQAEGLSALPQPESTVSSQQAPKLDWPVPPQFVDPHIQQPFSELGVSAATCNRLSELGYEKAFAVQTAVIPELLSCQRRVSPDPLPPILVNSFTGSGKTLAYTVPVVDLLRNRRVPCLRAVVLLPTKVLVQQVFSVFDQLVQGTSLRVLALKTDRTLAKEAQLLLNDVPDILVCTPGRLLEHCNRTHAEIDEQKVPRLLANLEMLVIDEADRLVGQSFQDWTDRLAEVLKSPDRPYTFSSDATSEEGDEVWHRHPQRLVFSATLTRNPAKLAALQIQAVPPALPRLFVVGDKQLDGNDEFKLPEQLQEKLVHVARSGDKPLVLVHELVYTVSGGRVIVFVRSNEAAARLARLISLVASLVFHTEIEAHRCSGEMRVQDRRRVMQEFASSASGVLVCTDMIARGIDMHVDYVVNYDVPAGPREYVHRVGRTARAGAEGSAWTLVSPGENARFNSLQSEMSHSSSIEEVTVVPEVNEEKYQQALSELGQEVLS